MFENVVVGVDGSEGGRDAIALAKALVSERGELTLAHVYFRDTHLLHPDSPGLDDVDRHRVGELLEKEREQAGIDANLRRRGAGSVGRGLHELAELEGADLLVIGSSKHALLQRVLVGDETRAALVGAPCSVALAPAGYSEQPTRMQEIGVGYDGSPESEQALRVAREIASQRRAKLSAFEAVSPPRAAFAGRARASTSSLEETVGKARDRIAALGGVEPHAAFGDPVEELVLYSASLDLLIVGSRGYGPIGRLVHGGVSQALARGARCPLLVLTRRAQHARGSNQGEDA